MAARNTDSIDKLAARPKVLVVTHYYATHGGGIERVADKLIQEISVGNRFLFTWAASDCDEQATKGNPEILPMKSVNLIEKLLGIPWPIWMPKSLSGLKWHVQNADIVWLHDTLYLGNILAFRWAKKFGKPVVVTQHIGFIPYKNPVLRLAMKLAEKIFTFRMLKGADQATFVSDRVAEYFYKKVSFTRAIQIVPNGVEARLYHPASREKRAWLRQQFALRDGQPVMLFVGRFVEKKGLSVLRELAKLLPDWRFWLAGNGPIKPEKWRLPNVHVFRDRTGESLVELYQAADLLLLPSYGEGFPLVIQEAMACGLPVLCGPETAAGSRLADPYLLKAEVLSKDPSRTAQIWASVLRGYSNELPREASDDKAALFASSAWGWPTIANAYTEIFRLVSRK
jgi:glycosyltransferase involved in cell wall biosynthesis